MTKPGASPTDRARRAGGRALIESILAESDAIVSLGVTLETLGEDTAVLTMAWQPRLSRGEGMYHGGPIASLIDIAGDMVVAVRAGGGVPPISQRVDYLRPCTGPYLRATARLRRYGRTISVSDVDVHDDQGRLCAVGRGTYSSLAG